MARKSCFASVGLLPPATSFRQFPCPCFCSCSCRQVSSTVSQANGQRTFAFDGQKLPKHRRDYGPQHAGLHRQFAHMCHGIGEGFAVAPCRCLSFLGPLEPSSARIFGCRGRPKSCPMSESWSRSGKRLGRLCSTLASCGVYFLALKYLMGFAERTSR